MEIYPRYRVRVGVGPVADRISSDIRGTKYEMLSTADAYVDMQEVMESVLRR